MASAVEMPATEPLSMSGAETVNFATISAMNTVTGGKELVKHIRDMDVTSVDTIAKLVLVCLAPILVTAILYTIYSRRVPVNTDPLKSKKVVAPAAPAKSLSGNASTSSSPPPATAPTQIRPEKCRPKRRKTPLHGRENDGAQVEANPGQRERRPGRRTLLKQNSSPPPASKPTPVSSGSQILYGPSAPRPSSAPPRKDSSTGPVPSVPSPSPPPPPSLSSSSALSALPAAFSAAIQSMLPPPSPPPPSTIPLVSHTDIDILGRSHHLGLTERESPSLATQITGAAARIGDAGLAELSTVCDTAKEMYAHGRELISRKPERRISTSSPSVMLSEEPSQEGLMSKVPKAFKKTLEEAPSSLKTLGQRASESAKDLFTTGINAAGEHLSRIRSGTSTKNVPTASGQIGKIVSRPSKSDENVSKLMTKHPKLEKYMKNIKEDYIHLVIDILALANFKDEGFFLHPFESLSGKLESLSGKLDHVLSREKNNETLNLGRFLDIKNTVLDWAQKKIKQTSLDDEDRLLGLVKQILESDFFDPEDFFDFKAHVQDPESQDPWPKAHVQVQVPKSQDPWPKAHVQVQVPKSQGASLTMEEFRLALRHKALLWIHRYFAIKKQAGTKPSTASSPGKSRPAKASPPSDSDSVQQGPLSKSKRVIDLTTGMTQLSEQEQVSRNSGRVYARASVVATRQASTESNV